MDFLIRQDFQPGGLAFSSRFLLGCPKGKFMEWGFANSLDGKHLAKHVELLKGLLPLIGLWMRMILFCCCHFQP